MEPWRLAAGWLLFSLLFVTKADGSTKGALKKEAAKKVCTKSKEIKGTVRYVANELSQVKDFVETLRGRETHLLRKISKESPKHRCETEVLLLLVTRKALRDTLSFFDRMANTGVELAGTAGIAAGRLDEFISVFQQTHGSGANQRCIAGTKSTSNAAQQSDLPDCYVGGEAAKADAEFISPGDAAEFSREVLKKFQAKAAGDVFEGPDLDKSTSDGQLDVTGTPCRLTGKDSTHGAIEGAAIAANIKWGGGIVEFSGNGAAQALTWHKDGEKIPLFKRAKQLLTSFSSESDKERRRRAEIEALWGKNGPPDPDHIGIFIDQLDNESVREILRGVNELIKELPEEERKTEEAFRTLVSRNCVKESLPAEPRERETPKESRDTHPEGIKPHENKVVAAFAHVSRLSVVLVVALCLAI